VKRRIGPVVVALVAVALVGVLIYGVSHQGSSRALDQALAAGRFPPAPSASRLLPVLDGVGAHSAALARWRGEVVVINFWASWCDTCNAEAGLLEHAQRLLTDQHTGTIVGIDYKDITGDALGSIKQFGLSYPNLRDIDGSFAETYGTAQLPETFVLNRNLDVVAIAREELPSLAWLMHAIDRAEQT
jgi:cytochrome c biogenesis protein CcmG/thiol:disulfide interchange protein DsbE